MRAQRIGRHYGAVVCVNAVDMSSSLAVVSSHVAVGYMV